MTLYHEAPHWSVPEAEWPAYARDPGHRTIFDVTIDARLIALDAATGRPRPDFADRGTLGDYVAAYALPA
jgi:glucose dehydrogenase